MTDMPSSPDGGLTLVENIGVVSPSNTTETKPRKSLTELIGLKPQEPLEQQKRREDVYGPREPSPKTTEIYARALAGEYMGILKAVDAISAWEKSGSQPPPPCELAPWQLNIFTTMGYRLNELEKQKHINWSTIKDKDKQVTVQTLFTRLLQEQDHSKDWHITGMMVAQRQLQALQLATEGKVIVAKPADKLDNDAWVDASAVSAVGGGKVESALEIDEKRKADESAKQKKPGPLKQALLFPLKVVASPVTIPAGIIRGALRDRWYGDDLAALERDDLRAFSQKRLFSSLDVDYPYDTTFDPDRRLSNGRELDFTQKEFAEEYRADFTTGQGTIDPDGVIGTRIKELNAAQADMQWSTWRNQLRGEDDFNAVTIRRDGTTGAKRYDSTWAPFAPVESGIDGLGKISVGNDHQMQTHLNTLTTAALGREVKKKDDAIFRTFGDVVDGQIKSLQAQLDKNDTIPEEKKKELEGLNQQEVATKQGIKELEEYAGIDDEIAKIDAQITLKKNEVSIVIEDQDLRLPTAKSAQKAAERDKNIVSEALQKSQQTKTERQQDLTVISEIKSKLNQQIIAQGALRTFTQQIDEIDVQLRAMGNNVNQGVYASLMAARNAAETSRTAQRTHYEQLESAIKDFMTGSIVRRVTSITPGRNKLAYLNDLAHHIETVEIDALEQDIVSKKADLEAKDEVLTLANESVQKLEANISAHKPQLDEIKRLETVEKVAKIQRKKTLESNYGVADKAGAEGKILTEKQKLADLEKKIKDIEPKDLIEVRHQKEVLKAYREHILDMRAGGKYDQIQDRAVNPHFFSRAGIVSATQHELAAGMQLRPDTHPGYLQMMMVIGGEDTLTLAQKDKYEALAKIVTPDMFMRIVFDNEDRRKFIEDTFLGTQPLPPRVDASDVRIQSKEVREAILGMVDFDFIQDVLKHLESEARAETLGLMSADELKTRKALDENRLEEAELKTGVERADRIMDEEVTKAVEVKIARHDYVVAEAVANMEGALVRCGGNAEELEAFAHIAQDIAEIRMRHQLTIPIHIADIYDASTNTWTAEGRLIHDAIISRNRIPSLDVAALDNLARTNPDTLMHLINTAESAASSGGADVIKVADTKEVVRVNLQNLGITLEPGYEHYTITAVSQWMFKNNIDRFQFHPDELWDATNNTLSPSGRQLREELIRAGIVIDTNLSEREQFTAIANIEETCKFQDDIPVYIAQNNSLIVDAIQLLGLHNNEVYLELAIDKALRRSEDRTGLSDQDVSDYLTQGAANQKIDAIKDELTVILGTVEVQRMFVDSNSAYIAQLVNEVIRARNQHVVRINDVQRSEAAQRQTATENLISEFAAVSPDVNRIEIAVLKGMLDRVDTNSISEFQKAFTECRLRGQSATLKTLIGYIPNNTRIRLFQGQVQGDLIGLYNNRIRGVNDPVIAIIDQLPEDHALRAFEMMHLRAGRDPEEVSASTQVTYRQLDREYANRQARILSRQYWGLQGDDLILTLRKHYIHESDALELAQRMAYMITQERNKQLTPRS